MGKPHNLFCVGSKTIRRSRRFESCVCYGLHLWFKNIQDTKNKIILCIRRQSTKESYLDVWSDVRCLSVCLYIGEEGIPYGFVHCFILGRLYYAHLNEILQEK